MPPPPDPDTLDDAPADSTARELPPPRHSRPVRYAFFVGGILSTVIGLIGIPTPGLPTTPLLLLAAFCFERSSPRMHRWLLSNRVFGPVIEQWQRDRSIDPRAKRMALIVIVVVFALSIYSVDPLPLRIMLVVIGLGVLMFVGRLPARTRRSNQRP